jgi:hypothetical protein
VLRLAVAVGLVVVIWEGGLIVALRVVEADAPSWFPLFLAGVLWMAALLVAFLLLNREGRFITYLAIAAIALIAAVVVVDRFAAIVYATHVAPA